MKTYTVNDISELESRFRANFINSLSGFKALQLIGSKNSEGQANLSIINSAHHLGANPPLMGYIQRPHTVEKHAYENILETKRYTFSNVLESYQDKAHQTSAKYPRSQSEFDACELEMALTPDGTPYVATASIVLELSYKNSYKIEENETILVVGQIENIFINEELILSDGTVDLVKAGSVAGVSLNGYVSPKNLVRYSYAKPGEELKNL